MRTLDELCDFLGFRIGATEVARFGGPVGGPVGSQLDLAGAMIQGPKAKMVSLAGMIDAVDDLPLLTLESRLISDRTAAEPYALRVQISPSAGIVWYTSIRYVLNGGKTYGQDEDFGAAGGEVTPTSLGAGEWEIIVERNGIGRFGLTVLTRSLGRVYVTREPAQPPTPPPPVHPPPTVTWVTCQVEMDLDNPGFGGITNFRVYGGGFESREDIDLFQDDRFAFTTTSNDWGGYSGKVSISQSQFPLQHVFFARGQRSKRVSMKAGVSV